MQASHVCLLDSRPSGETYSDRRSSPGSLYQISTIKYIYRYLCNVSPKLHSGAVHNLIHVEPFSRLTIKGLAISMGWAAFHTCVDPAKSQEIVDPTKDFHTFISKADTKFTVIRRGARQKSSCLVFHHGLRRVRWLTIGIDRL